MQIFFTEIKAVSTLGTTGLYRARAQWLTHGAGAWNSYVHTNQMNWTLRSSMPGSVPMPVV